MMSLLKFLRDLLFVPKCAGCLERLDPSAGALCDGCRTAYLLETEKSCPFCGGTACACTGEEGGVLGKTPMIKLFRYYPHEGETVTNRMIYLLKHRAPRPLIEELAASLAERIRPHLDGDLSSYLVTFPPRSRRARAEYGFDHMELLSRAVALRLGLAWQPLLVRHGGQEQKKSVSRTARFRNMKNAYRLRSGVDPGGRRILLLDDVVASGATLSSAMRTLRRAGARKITVAVLGYTL